MGDVDVKKLLGRLEALVCTGAPGLYRVLTFWVVQRIYSLDELGTPRPACRSRR
ncbi:hypothetical protein [Burkholderia cepacia]|uniref:hypothetical protein n=1 Tax=Burkholderia cepacia TaxID=292 RepID=UPI00298FD761|nr:hypothetical protein [Burkholderia cepacia]MDW9247415.1 hypothetical protein [Burkholderia cepacia]